MVVNTGDASKLFHPCTHTGLSLPFDVLSGTEGPLKVSPLATNLIDLENLQLLSGQDYILMLHVCIKDLRQS